MRKKQIIALLPKKYRKKVAFFVTIISLLVGLSGAFFLQGKVVRVADGDTFSVLTHGTETKKIRLYGIDAPESNQPFGQESWQILREQALYQPVKLDIVATDQYGRSVALAYLPDGTCINRLMVQQGAAWVYRSYCDRLECVEWLMLERKAKSAKKGLWAGKNPKAPWNWRRNARR